MRSVVMFLQTEEAATSVEYAVMLALILGTIIGAVGAFGQGANGMWSGINCDLRTVGIIK
ncbi:MAG: Flp family type IVb pilin [Thermoguttaceae bacterium]